MPLEQGDFDRIQAMFDKVIPRLEYEQRHANIKAQVDKLQQDVREYAKYTHEEHLRMNQVTDNRFHEYQQALKELEHIMTGNKEVLQRDIKEIKDNMATSQGLTLRYVVSTVVSFLFGGGILAIIEFVRGK